MVDAVQMGTAKQCMTEISTWLDVAEADWHVVQRTRRAASDEQTGDSTRSTKRARKQQVCDLTDFPVSMCFSVQLLETACKKPSCACRGLPLLTMHA